MMLGMVMLMMLLLIKWWFPLGISKLPVVYFQRLCLLVSPEGSCHCYHCYCVGIYRTNGIYTMCFFGGGDFFICPCLLSRLWYWVSDLELFWWSMSLLIAEILSQSSKSHGSWTAKSIGHWWWLLFGSLVLFGGCGVHDDPNLGRAVIGFCQVLRARQRSMRAKLKAGRLDF